MLMNLLMLFAGGVCGVMCMSCLIVGTIEEERTEAYQRGLEKGRLLGILEEKGRNHD